MMSGGVAPRGRGLATSIPTPGRMLQAIVAALFGYDFFVSYAHRDGAAYPEALADALSAEPYRYKVHLDRRDYHVGDDLGLLTRLRVRNSQKLVVVAGDAALNASRWVRAEVEAFAAHGRNPIVIDHGQAVERALAAPAAPGMLLEWLQAHPALLRHPEQAGLPAPSEDTLRRLGRAFDGMRTEVRRRRVVGAAIALLVLLLIAATVFGVVAETQRRAAVEQRLRVERELSRADARQALAHLRVGRDDAAAAFLARALKARRSDLAELVGHMLPEPRFLPTGRLRLPASSGSITRAWADPEGRYLAIEEATEPERVRVYEWAGDAARALFELRVPSHDAVFTLISQPRPAALWLMRADVMSAPGTGSPRDRLVMRPLDAQDGRTFERALPPGTGYHGFVQLADGRFHHARGPTLSALRITATGIEIEETPTGLSGHVNRLGATPGAPCLMVSDTSGRFVVHHVDGRPPQTWDSAPLWRNTAHAAQHAQGLLDPTCRHAIVWTDGGPPQLFLVRLSDVDGSVAVQRVAEIDADPRDSADFRNRHFTSDGAHLLVRNQGRWSIYETATGTLLRTIDVGQPESNGTLAGHDHFLAAGFGDTVSHATLAGGPGSSGQVTAGTSPFVLPLQAAPGSAVDPATAFLTISRDGLVTRFASRPGLQVESMSDPGYLRLDASRRVYTADGSLSARGLFFTGGERFVLLQRADGGGSAVRFDCPRATDFDLLEDAERLRLAAVTADGWLCIAAVDRDAGALGAVTKWPLGVAGSFDLLRTRDRCTILVADRRAGHIREVALRDDAAPRMRPVARAGRLGPIADLAVDRRGDWGVLSERGFSRFASGRWTDAALPRPCSAIIGLADRRAVLACPGTPTPALLEVSARGEAHPVPLPANVDPMGATISPDGATLLAPLRDGNDWAREVYARLMDSGMVLTFAPRVLPDLLAQPGIRSDRVNRLPRVDALRHSPDGSRLVVRIRIDFANAVLVSFGPLQRFAADAVARRVGLALASTGASDELVYAQPGPTAPRRGVQEHAEAASPATRPR